MHKVLGHNDYNSISQCRRDHTFPHGRLADKRIYICGLSGCTEIRVIKSTIELLGSLLSAAADLPALSAPISICSRECSWECYGCCWRIKRLGPPADKVARG